MKEFFNEIKTNKVKGLKIKSKEVIGIGKFKVKLYQVDNLPNTFDSILVVPLNGDKKNSKLIAMRYSGTDLVKIKKIIGEKIFITLMDETGFYKTAEEIVGRKLEDNEKFLEGKGRLITEEGTVSTTVNNVSVLL